MQTDWFRDLKGPDLEEQKADRRELVKAHAPVLELLTTILEAKLRDNVAAQEQRQNYASPAWPFEQADHNGTQRTLKSLLSLIDLTKETK